MKGVIIAALKYVRVTEQGYPKATIVETGKSHANDPYVLKKAAKSKEMLRKVKFPDHLKK
ncbi:hypothetical protein [Pedobacter psychroterrae]|uniref:Uncharacterized protein n=1 Tax=Pedobacter psychroterrae TaxID=2530453 RepID=A0A4R0NP90_9SPHI|nr:hypothetical protein [Pedobacter psychroterrae]TCD00984.1 hypothetical protein EZ437_09430 [Pedobacter psychroterrae]